MQHRVAAKAERIEVGREVPDRETCQQTAEHLMEMRPKKNLKKVLDGR
jgi:hypothetical protein